MKILQISNQNIIQQQNGYKTPLFLNNLGRDTFVSLSPSFKQANPKICKQILDNPDLLHKFATGFTTAFMALLSGAAAEKVIDSNESQTENDENNSTDINTENYLNQADIITKLQDKIAELEQKIAELTSGTDKTTSTNRTATSKLYHDSEQNLVGISFPKKHGRLSGKEEKFKSIIENIRVSECAANKMSFICKELISKSELSVNGNIINKTDVMEEFGKELTNAETTEEKEEIIKEYGIKLGLIADKEEENSNNNITTKSDNNTTEELSAIEQTAQGALNTQQHQNRRIIITANTANLAGTENPKAKFLPIPNAPGCFKYRIPAGTTAKNLNSNLTDILNVFEKNFREDFFQRQENENKKLRWYHREPVGKITVKEIKDEIQRNRDSLRKSNIKLPKQNIHSYNNINEDNAEIVANAINEDDRFSNLFSRHAALRFIDRCIDFNSECPIEEQCSRALDKLEEIVQRAVKGGLDIETFTDGYNFSPRIHISDDYFDEESAMYFGTYPIIIGIGENQPDRNFYKTYDKKALICTIFPDGI